jgi:hypothetical protein
MEARRSSGTQQKKRIWKYERTSKQEHPSRRPALFSAVGHSVQATLTGALRAAWTEPRPTRTPELTRGRVFYGRLTAIRVKTHSTFRLTERARSWKR